MNAVHEISRGLFDAHLGHGLYKKRVARMGQGKRGGYRTLLAFKEGKRSVFIFGFAKNERNNISEREKLMFLRLAQDVLNASEAGIEQLLRSEELIEVKNG